MTRMPAEAPGQRGEWESRNKETRFLRYLKDWKPTQRDQRAEVNNAGTALNAASAAVSVCSDKSQIAPRPHTEILPT